MVRGTREASGSGRPHPRASPAAEDPQVVNDALFSLDADFEALYTDFGRPSIRPERLIRASLIQILFSIRSELQLMEKMQYNLLFRWVIGLEIDESVWALSVFTGESCKALGMFSHEALGQLDQNLASLRDGAESERPVALWLKHNERGDGRCISTTTLHAALFFCMRTNLYSASCPNCHRNNMPVYW